MRLYFITVGVVLATAVWMIALSNTFGSDATDPTAAGRPATATPTTATGAEAGQISATVPAAPITNAPTTVTGDGACFRLVLRDDFDGPTLGDQWRIYDSPGSHSDHAIRRPDAVSIENGKLVITATNDADGVLVSGGIRHLHSQTYGLYSIRVRTDADPSNSTSGVILTWPVSGNQPLDGENNIYETARRTSLRSPFFSFIHEPFDDRADGVAQEQFIHESSATLWQTMTMEWTPDYVVIDRAGPHPSDHERHRLDESDDDRIADAEHHLAIQLDQFEPTMPDGARVRMEVDWVEVYEPC